MNVNVENIPMGVPFLKSLVHGILKKVGKNPLSLAEVTVLLPTRRACRSFREELVKFGNGVPVILPKIFPIGEIELEESFSALEESNYYLINDSGVGIPPAISPLRRRLLLAQLILKKNKSGISKNSFQIQADQALLFAKNLSGLLDQIQTEEVTTELLKGIVPDSLAGHWQDSLEFLNIIFDHWPNILNEEHVLDPVVRRNKILDSQSNIWEKTQPKGLIIAAGSTGSIPATARLLSVIASLPQGIVILPGLDREMSNEIWDKIEFSHPQYTIKQLLKNIKIKRNNVKDWVGLNEKVLSIQKSRFIAEALQSSSSWYSEKLKLGDFNLTDLSKIVCSSSSHEARCIALALRGILEFPEKQAALVTPDRNLARRVSVELKRWNIIVDDSAGVPLFSSRIGTFLNLIANFFSDRISGISILSVLKHPLALGGKNSGDSVKLRDLELLVLRDSWNQNGLEGVLKSLISLKGIYSEDINLQIEYLINLFEKLVGYKEQFVKEIGKKKSNIKNLFLIHVQLAEYLATSTNSADKTNLWSGDDGEIAASWMSELIDQTDVFPEFELKNYSALFKELMSDVVIYSNTNKHPRLHIWSPLEARLHQVDLMILGGLNEGTWPQDESPGNWISREMRASVGLNSSEKKIGLSAHDFYQATGSNKVILTRSSMVDGELTTPSRWLVKIEAFLGSFGLSLPDSEIKDWERKDSAIDKSKTIRPPSPCPPLEARPRIFSATIIEDLIRDPYSVYASKILGLKRLEDIDVSAKVYIRGTLFHKSIDLYLQNFSEIMNTKESLETLMDYGKLTFDSQFGGPKIRPFWWYQFSRMAQWFVQNEFERRKHTKLVGREIQGQLSLNSATGSFKINARADRIDRFNEGGLAIIDYKTGSVPELKDMQIGLSPQLPIEAVIASLGGFSAVESEKIIELSYWSLNGRGDGGETITRMNDKEAIGKLIENTKSGLSDLVSSFDNQSMPYLSKPRPEYHQWKSDYDHLAREQEWSVGFLLKEDKDSEAN